MTKLLEKALRKASRLPENLQDQLAMELMEEIEWESRWDETLARTQDQLDTLAGRAARQYKAGKTRQMGIDEL
ncbi:MAG: hypothetical protein A2Z34_10500 [Planctomycetes bacterium RBG_16_59_8]|nr:MAG: hypothetical protein A2Z34_10500 [Planctomycetes bacterium RBG_16_59_8]